jgi:hypothetical protein
MNKKLLNYIDTYVNISITDDVKDRYKTNTDIDTIYLKKDPWDTYPYLLGYYHYGHDNENYDHRVLEYSDIKQFSEKDAEYFDVNDKSTIIDIEGLLLAHPEMLLDGDDSEIFHIDKRGE